MAIKKFQPILAKKVEADMEYQEEQEKLKKKHGLDGNIVIVEKANMLKFIIRTLGKIIRLAAAILLVTLAFAGLTAFIYPAPRMELIRVITTMVDQLHMFIS